MLDIIRDDHQSGQCHQYPVFGILLKGVKTVDFVLIWVKMSNKTKMASLKRGFQGCQIIGFCGN